MQYLYSISRNYVIIFVLGCLLAIATNAPAQQDQTPSPWQYTPFGLLDDVFDDKGNRFSLADIAISNELRALHAGHETAAIVPATCSSGYFQLFLEPGCGMEGTDAASAARLSVLCRVLQDISALISSPCTATGQKVNIWVRGGAGGSALGVASPFYNVPHSAPASGITDNTIWITINSGKDAFSSVAGPLVTSGGGASGVTFFHGSIAFNFTGSINWHTNLATAPPAGKYDLYTVALHEMMHAMGFGTLIDYNGNSVIGGPYPYYTRYDKHLRTATGVPLLTSATPSCSMYGHTINPALSPITTYLSPGGTAICPSGYQTGTSVNHTICSNALVYAGSWPVNIPVYTPECFEKGSSLSHFEDECYVPSTFSMGAAGPATNDHYYAMSNAGGPGPHGPTNLKAMKRYLTPEERNVLCDIGYTAGGTFGSVANLNYINYGTSCAGLQVAGINDGIGPAGTFAYTVAPSTSGSININVAGTGILSNDYGVTGGSYKCLEVLIGGGTVSATSGGAASSILYYPGTGTGGIRLLRYIPVSSSGAEGNITYVFIYVTVSNCVPSACNMVSNSDFESITAPLATATFNNLNCWGPLAGSCDLFKVGCFHPSYCVPGNIAFFTNGGDTHPLAAATNNVFLGGVSGRTSSGTFTTEASQNRLVSPLLPGNTYHVSCWVRLADKNGMQVIPTKMLFAVSPLAVIVPSSSTFTAPPAGLTTLCEFTPADTGWHYFSQYVTYTGPVAYTLAIMGAPWLNPLVPPYTSTYTHYITYDDVSIMPVTGIPSFNLPDTMMTCTPLRLDTLVNTPGGTFTWQRDSSGYAVNTHDTVFNALSAYSASSIMDDTGRVTVCYYYTSPLGCTQNICKNTYIIPGTTPVITFWPPTLCVGSIANVAATPSGGSWSSSNTGILTTDPVTGMLTGISPGLAILTYTLPFGCFSTVYIAVEAYPISGIPVVDIGMTTTLANSTTGGTWSSGNVAIATVGLVSGIVTGISPGTASITYTTPSGCEATVVVTVNTMPPTGIRSVAGHFSALEVVPQPTKGNFVLTGTYTGPATFAATDIVVTNLLGRIVLSSKASVRDNVLQKQLSLPADLPNGIYLLKIAAGNGTETVKIILFR